MNRRSAFLCGPVALFAALAVFLPGQMSADPSHPEKIPILLDNDIGSDIDDAFALALALASPELDLQGVTTCCTAGQPGITWGVTLEKLRAKKA